MQYNFVFNIRQGQRLLSTFPTFEKENFAKINVKNIVLISIFLLKKTFANVAHIQNILKVKYAESYHLVC